MRGERFICPELEFGAGCDIAVISASGDRADLYEVKTCSIGGSDAQKAASQLNRSADDLRGSGQVQQDCTFRRYLLHDNDRRPGCHIKYFVAAYRDRRAFKLVSSRDDQYRRILARYRQLYPSQP